MKYFAPFRLDAASQILWRGDVRVPLTHKASEILSVLVGRAGHVVPKETLIESVWPGTHVHPDNVKVLVGEIRRALGDDPAKPKYIRSIIKRGYVFIAPVVDTPADQTQPPAAPIFVGRNREIERLTGMLAAAADADRRLVFITGEGGIGKTALCEAFLRVAVTRQAIRATWAQCARVTGPSEPYYPILDALTRLMRGAGEGDVGSVLARHAPSWIPHLTAMAGGSWQAVSSPRVASPARMLREIVTAFEALAEHMTLVLWIEDLQWADPATIDVLASLGQRRDPARLLVLATTRVQESTPSASAARRAYADLLAHGQAEEIRLDPLPVVDVGHFLSQRFGPEIAERTADVLTRSTNGHPLFLTTAVDHLVRKGHFSEWPDGWRLTVSPDALEAAVPASLVGSVTEELEELAADERHAVEAAGVVGVEFSLWLAAHAAEVDELAFEPILEMLSRRRSFIEREGVIELANGVFSPLYRFRHALCQEIVFDRIPATTRATIHRRIGVAMERMFSGREREIAVDLASHFHGAGDHARAARFLQLAAGNALKRYAPREAAALLHGAVVHASHLPADERPATELALMMELARAQSEAGEISLATMTWKRAERRAEETHQPDVRLRALVALAEANYAINREDALRYAQQIVAAVPTATDPALGASALIRAGITELQFVGWSDETAERCFEAFASLPRSGSEDQRSLAIRLLLIQYLRTSYANALTAGRKLLPLALRSGNLADCIYCYYLLGIAALHLGRWGDALEMAREGIAIAEKAGHSRYIVTMRLLESWIHLEAQRWDEARALALRDRDLLERSGWSNTLQHSLLFGGAAALGLGQLDDAERDLGRLRDWYAEERVLLDWYWQIQMHVHLTDLALRRKDRQRATAESIAARQSALATPERTWRARAYVSAAQVAIEEQTFAEADRLLRHARREIRGIDAPLASWRVEAVTATLLERTAQPDSARRARDRYERTLGRLERSIQQPPRTRLSEPSATRPS